MALIVTGLWVYPIKSCRGSRLDIAQIDARGIAMDRGLMVVDADGGFISQREHPALALVEPALNEDLLTVRAPGMQPLQARVQREGRAQRVVVWRDVCDAIDQGDPIGTWFSEYLGVRARLVAMADTHARRLDARYARSPADQTAFADGYPFLLTTEASLTDLNSRLAAAVPMDRFRPNIVVAGNAAYAEDSWKLVRVGNLDFSVVKPCARCVMTTTDQATGSRSDEPLRTLSTYRARHGKVMFGQNLIHHGPGVLRMGDALTVL